MVQSLPAPAVPAESSSQLDFPRPPWHCKHWECSWAHLGRRQGWFYPVALGPFAADLKQEHVTNQEAKKTLDASRSSSLKQGCYQTKLAWWGFNIMHCRYREQHFRRNTYITDLWIKPERGGWPILYCLDNISVTGHAQSSMSYATLKEDKPCVWKCGIFQIHCLIIIWGWVKIRYPKIMDG